MKRGLATVFLLLCATFSMAGTTYTFTTVVEGDGAKSTTRTRVWTTAGSLKMLFVQSDEPGTPVASYVLRPASASALYLVNPEKKTYVRWDPKRALQGTPSKLQILSARFEKVSQEQGEQIAGFATMHYAFRLTYTMRAEVFGQQTDTPVSVDQEYWVADDPRLKDIKAANLLQSQAATPQFAPELQRTIAEETDKLRGTPLRTSMRFILRLPAREQQTTMTSEISEIKSVAISAARFRIPTGYRQVSPEPEEVEEDAHAH